ncbi:MAG: hypothetical protein M3094_06865 [Actinomycetia bacterium]|nr:hypothetical protein [Actinomycetes bacterium]
MVEDAVRPFTDLEYVHTSGRMLDDIGHVVTMTDGWIFVQHNWVHDLTSVDPGEAALLLAMIETANNIEGLDIGALRSLRRPLDAISHTSVREPVPAAVADLVSAKHNGVVISARHEGSDMRVTSGSMLYEVHEVWWTPHGWRALLTLYGESDPRPVEVVPELLHDIQLTEHRFERRSLTMSEDMMMQKMLEIEIEFPLEGKWLLDYYGLEILSDNGETAIGRIHIDVGHGLDRLLLRLGPKARILNPEWFAHKGEAAAVRILDLYRFGT